MARFTYIPQRVIDSDGIADGASIQFYASGTTTPINIYSDAGFTTPLTNPYVVASGASVPAIYFAEETARVVITSDSGVVISDDDPYDGALTPSGSARVDTFTGDGSTTDFTLTVSPGTVQALDVSINGVVQVPGTDFTLVGGTLKTLRFTTAPANTTAIAAQYYQGLISEGSLAQDVTLASGETVQDALESYTTRTALKAISPVNGVAYRLTEAGREGVFVYRTGDYSAEVAADTQEGIYLKVDSIAATVGALVRAYDGAVNLTWFGAVGDNSNDDTAAVQAAINWVGGAENRVLLWDAPNVRLTSAVTLPDASRWAIEVEGDVTITQATDNTRHFLWTLTASRFDVGLFEGGKVTFKWANNQPAANTTAQAIGLNPTANIPDGLYRVRVGALQNDNGYDLVAFTAAAASAPYNMPTWNWFIEALVHETQATGRLWSPTPNSGAGGAPASYVRSMYIKGTNASTAPINLTSHIQLTIGSLEIGNASQRMALFSNCDGLRIEQLRVENCDLDNLEDLVTFTGASTFSIGHLDVKTVTNTGANLSGAVKAATNAQLNITDGIEVAGCSVSGAGDLAVLQTQGSSKIMLPANVLMQTTSNDVFLYAKADAANYIHGRSHIIGPFSFNTVSGASFSQAVAAYDGTSTINEYPIPVDGYIVGFFVRLSAAITAGTLDVVPLINGTAVASGAYKAAITSGQDGSAYAVYAWEPPTINALHSVSAGDRLIMRLNATGVTGGGNATISVLIAERV